MHNTFDLVIIFLWNFPTWTKSMHTAIQCNIVCTSKNWKQSKCLPTQNWLNTFWNLDTMGYSAAPRKNEETCNVQVEEGRLRKIPEVQLRDKMQDSVYCVCYVCVLKKGK